MKLLIFFWLYTKIGNIAMLRASIKICVLELFFFPISYISTISYCLISSLFFNFIVGRKEKKSLNFV